MYGKFEAQLWFQEGFLTRKLYKVKLCMSLKLSAWKGEVRESLSCQPRGWSVVAPFGICPIVKKGYKIVSVTAPKRELKIALLANPRDRILQRVQLFNWL